MLLGGGGGGTTLLHHLEWPGKGVGLHRPDMMRFTGLSACPSIESA